MSLARLSVRRPVTTIMVCFGVLLLGVIAWLRLPQELYPPITYPQLTVVTKYKDAAPEEIEVLVTKPIEEVTGTVSGLRRVSSISKEEVSLVIAEFNWGTNMDFAGLGVREKIDLIKERLPRGSEDPVVIKYNPFELPVLVVNASGGLPAPELLQVVRKQVKNELEKVEGVAAVNLSGGLEREIIVEVDQGRLYASGMPISNVVEGLSRANMNYPAGTIKEAFYEYLIRTMGEFEIVPEIPKIAVGVEEEKGRVGRREPEQEDRPGPLKREKGVAAPQHVIQLKDVAVVRDTFKERSSVSRFNGKENVSLSVQKQAEANTLQVASRVKEMIARISPTLPTGVRLDIAYDQSLFIHNAIAGVRDAALQGGGLAFIILFLFLGNVFAALNVALAIPISILATIGAMYFSGVSINIISMGGLALGIGLLVDAGIVVVENIDRHRAMKKAPTEAAIEGASEVSSAIMGTVLTTVVVFIPMVFVVGIAGQLFKQLAYTVIASNLASWAVSMTLTALFASRIRAAAQGDTVVDPFLRPLARFQDAVVSWFLANRLVGVALIVLLFVVSLGAMKFLDRELLPRVDQGQFIIRGNFPPGTRLEVTDQAARRIEKALKSVPEIQDVTLTIGSSKEKRAEEMLETLGSHQAQILVGLKPKAPAFSLHPEGFRKRKASEIVQELKETLAREPLGGMEIEYLLQESSFKSSFLAGTPVVLEVKGTDLAPLDKIAQDVQAMLEDIPGLFGVKTSQVPSSPETKVKVLKDRAAAYHLSVSDIALTAQTAVKGFIATKFKEQGREIDVRVQLREPDRRDLNKVRRLMIHSPLGFQIPLAEVAYFAIGKGPTEIRHLDQQRTILVSAQLFQRPLNEALEDVNRRLKEYKIPKGYTIALTGENQQMQESFQSLAFALLLAILLVYMVMASEFESLWQPFLIMGTIPMSLIGVVLVLWLTHTPISVMVGLGFIVLGGIVVDNGIVLIDYVNLLRNQGMGLEEAVREASRTRLRPILMTAASTVLGVLPLALGLGEGVELQGPMAITMMGGLTVATFLTLIFLPTLYVIGAGFFERFQRKPPAEPPAMPAEEPPPEFPPAPPVETLPLLPPPAPPMEKPPVAVPEIPEEFGNEEAAPTQAASPAALIGSFLTGPEPAESLSKPPQVPELSPVPVEPAVRGEAFDSAAHPEPVEGRTGQETPPSAPEAPLNLRQLSLLEYLRTHGRITRKEYVDLTGASVPTAARDLKELVDRGLIEGFGPLARGRYYVLVKKE